MPHVITQACCGDASCVYACPVNCIHPTPDEPGFGTAEMLYVDPSTCVDCGACVSACPVGAIAPSHRLAPDQQRFIELNADHYGEPADAVRFPVDPRRRLPMAPIGKPAPLRGVPDVLEIAIVGSGPAAMYAADELLKHPQVRVTVYERLTAPYGLARYGVAPDHRSTRRVMEFFDRIARSERLEILLGVQVGREVTLPQLDDGHHAVIWAGGAPTDRPLAIDGVGLPGTQSATSVVGWYNGHPDFTDAAPGLDTDSVVVIGNGNVALDVARILTADPDRLADTSIDRRALAALRDSSVREVVVAARRGPEHAAFTLPELVGLADGPGRVWVDPDELGALATPAVDDPEKAAKIALLHEISRRERPTGPHVRLTFGRTPEAVLGGDRATGLRLRRVDGGAEEIDAGLILTAVGYHGVPVPGLPFDPATGTVRNERGRVLADDGTAVPGRYVTGWAKRGPTGFIGTNKTDSQETVRALLDDAQAGVLAAPTRAVFAS